MKREKTASTSTPMQSNADMGKSPSIKNSHFTRVQWSSHMFQPLNASGNIVDRRALGVDTTRQTGEREREREGVQSER